ncbi:MAG TPA: antibiotic biosynthesis monooxygenase [Candidatus Acidoferrales bacterium]|jgi:heme-degrading monooxygenase HmoA|nr:antibiotic biosynthesis monooxygenase [Candidatus Acidoferrales bacterium]
MFVVLWEYEVKPGCEESFQSAYGPQGDWVRLFQADPHFRKTRLLQDLSRPHFYFTLDYWDSETSFEQFKAANQAAYAAIDRVAEALTFSERHLSSFNLETL